MSKSSQQFRMRSKPGTETPEDAVWMRKPWNGPFLIIGSFLFVAAVACIYASALAQQAGDHEDKALPPKSPSGLANSALTEAVSPIHKATAEESALSGKNEFGQFPPYTEAERELEKMLRGRDEDVDLALRLRARGGGCEAGRRCQYRSRQQ